MNCIKKTSSKSSNHKLGLEKRNIVQELLDMITTENDTYLADNQLELFLVGFNSNPHLNEIKPLLTELKDRSVLKVMKTFSVIHPLIQHFFLKNGRKFGF